MGFYLICRCGFHFITWSCSIKYFVYLLYDIFVFSSLLSSFLFVCVLLNFVLLKSFYMSKILMKLIFTAFFSSTVFHWNNSIYLNIEKLRNKNTGLVTLITTDSIDFLCFFCCMFCSCWMYVVIKKKILLTSFGNSVNRFYFLISIVHLLICSRCGHDRHVRRNSKKEINFYYF